jgi:hypothetical protein
MIKIFLKTLFAVVGLLALPGCKSLDEHLSKSNNPILYARILGSWASHEMLTYNGYKGSILPESFATTLRFEKFGKFSDSDNLIAEFARKRDQAVLSRYEWQIAEDGNAYLTAYDSKGQKYTDFRLYFLTRDQLAEKLRLSNDKIPVTTQSDEIFLLFHNPNDCKASEAPIRIMAGAHGCAPITLGTVIRKVL